MPIGTGVDTMHNVPAVPFTPSPAMFDAMTSKNKTHPISFSTPGAGQTVTRELPKAGILTWVTVTFEGTITYAAGTGAATTTWRWPYGILQNLAFAANLQNGLINCNGIDLHVFRILNNPAYIDATDTFPGTVGGVAALGTGSSFMRLTYQVPVVMDKVTLAGCIYAQSNQNALTLSVTEAPLSDYVTLTGTASASLTGTWTYHIDSYEIPQDPEHGIITPDLSRLHGIQARETGFTSTGDIPVALTQVNGQLTRLLLQVRPNLTSYINPKPAATKDLNNVKLVYGANQTPLDYEIGDLVTKNNEQYGAPLPYGYVCLDFVRENAVRDAVFMPGLTDLKVVPTIDASQVVTVDGKIRVVQEMLFQ